MQVDVVTPRSKREPCTVHVSGDVDIYSAAEIANALDKLIVLGNYHLLINLKTARYIDSAGLTAFISALKRIREHDGSINFVSPNPTIKRVIEISGLREVFGLYDDEQSAMKAWAGNRSGTPKL